MFSKPMHGWSRVEIGDFSGTASYLDDVPFNCLDTLIEYYSNSNINSIAITFDEEGSEFTIVSNFDCTYVIISRDTVEIIEIAEMNIDKLTKNIIQDIERDINEWVEWLCYEEPTPNRKEDLLNKIELLKEFVKEK